MTTLSGHSILTSDSLVACSSVSAPKGFVRELTRYSLSVLTVGVAFVITSLLWTSLDPHPTALFILAVVVTAWRAGLGPSLLATLLAVLTVDYFFIPPFFGLELTADNLTRSGVFVLVAVLISSIDLSRRRALAERDRLLASEAAARLEAERANKAKDEFLAMVSHELRTPLGVMLGWTRMLREEGQLDEAARVRAIEAIERNALRQKRLVGDLLDVSRIAAGKLQFEMRPLQLVPIIEASIESVSGSLKAKNIRLHADFDYEASEIHGDPERLQQVMSNLLSNAIKFTPEGRQIEVRLEHVRTHARIVVHDTGAGIPSEFLPFVFDRFRQSEGAMNKKHGGLGLGLAIVRHITEAHGGTVHATSAGDGFGATFTVELPLLSGTTPSSRNSISTHAIVYD